MSAAVNGGSDDEEDIEVQEEHPWPEVNEDTKPVLATYEDSQDDTIVFYEEAKPHGWLKADPELVLDLEEVDFT